MRIFTFPKLLRKFYPGAIWEMDVSDKIIFLTFDDGPNPIATPYVLEVLNAYNAKATFFCLGNNVAENPELYKLLKANGHVIGSHGYAHLKGWKTGAEAYLNDVKIGKEYTGGNLFRPPYGKMTKKQFSAVRQLGLNVVFWSVISYDFDAKFSSEQRRKVMLNKVKPGSIIVFHDSLKSLPQLKNDLPFLLESWKKQGYSFKGIT